MILVGSVSLWACLTFVRVFLHVAAAAEPGDAVVARFTGGQLTVADVERAAANKVAHARARYAAEGGRERLLTELVRWELLVREADARGYARNPVVYEASTKAAVAALEADLAVDPATIPSDEVAQSYERNAAQFHMLPGRRASMIKLATEGEARDLIEELAGANRLQFAAAARERSIDEATRRQGGELGYFDRDGRQRAKRAGQRVAAELAEAVFALAEVGSVSKVPVPYAGGFAVLMLTGQMRAVERSLAQAQDEIREQLAVARSRDAVEALVARLRAEHPPETHLELLDAIDMDDIPAPDVPHGVPAAPPDPFAPTVIVEPDEI